MHAFCANVRVARSALTERIRILEEAAADTGNTASGVRDKFAKELSDHEDIFEYLRAEIHKKNSEVNDLREEQQRMQEEREEVEQEHEKALQVAGAFSPCRCQPLA